MTYSSTGYKHIQLSDEQVPMIEGTMMKVVELIASHLAYGWSPEELHFQYPHIALSKIYSALAYYWDHREDLDADMEQRLERVETLRQSAPPSSMAQKLREHGFSS